MTFIGDSQVDELHVQMRPDYWHEDAEEVHGISKRQADLFDTKANGLRLITSYLLAHKGVLCCHANPRMFGVENLYDYTILKNEFRKIDQYYYFISKFETGNYQLITTHTITKHRLKLKKYSLDAIAEHFGLEFGHHDSKEDTKVLAKIYFKLNDIQEINVNEYDLLQSWRVVNLIGENCDV